MPFDERIVSGAWVTTGRWGKAVCITVEPHRHRVGPPDHLVGPDGICHCACENNECEGASYVSYRYRATRYHDNKEIWVWNGDLTEGPEKVTFLSSPTRFTARILKLTGPYGEGKPACGPYLPGYCACGEKVHG